MGLTRRCVILAELGVVLFLVLLNGVFSGAEIAILSLRRTRVDELVEAGTGGARAVAQLRENPERFLATVQVGITVIGATAAAFGGASVAARLEPWIARVPMLADSAGRMSLGVVVVGVSYLSLVLGELVPKSLALRASEPYALLIGRPLSVLAYVARPLVWVLTASSNVFLRLFGDRTSFIEARLSADELRQLVDEAATAGTVDPHAGEIASRALAFSELDVSSVMVPRREIASVDRNISIDELARVACGLRYARLLVYEGDPENIVGLVNVREVLARSRCESAFELDSALHPITFVPSTMQAPTLLRELQRKRTHLAVVVDEQGTIRGLVTVEDLVEELVGEILSEGASPKEGFRREADGAAIIKGAMPIHEANRELGLDLPEGESVSTVGGLCIERAGRIPTEGDRIRIDGIELEIAEATHRRVKLIRVRHADITGDS